jgi:hypothetical protein
MCALAPSGTEETDRRPHRTALSDLNAGPVDDSTEIAVTSETSPRHGGDDTREGRRFFDLLLKV